MVTSSSFVEAPRLTTVTGFATAVARSTSASSSAGAVEWGSSTAAMARRTALRSATNELAIERATCVPVGSSTSPTTRISAPPDPCTAAPKPSGTTNIASIFPSFTKRRPSGSDGTVRISIAPLSCTAGRTWSTKTAETSDRSASATA